MTDDWDFYFCRVDDRLASKFVDLGALELAPVERLPYMAYVRLPMNAPRNDGLSSQGEFDALVAVEDALEAELVDADTAYLGRSTTNGYRDFFFYLAASDTWSQRVAKTMQAFPAYRHEADAREDADWSIYLSYLSPNETERHCIENRRVCESLERHGDALTAEREIDHWAYFESAEARDAFVTAATQLGFALRVASDPDGEQEAYGAQVWRADIPSYRGIDDVTFPLDELATEHGGSYDGWECVVVSDEA